MKLLMKLVLREAWYHRSRMFLALIATLACACMIVWLLGAVDLMKAIIADDGEKFLGDYHFAVLPERPGGPGGPGGAADNEPSRGPRRGGPREAITAPIIESLRNEPMVQRLDEVWQQQCALINPVDIPLGYDENGSSQVQIPQRSPVLFALDRNDSPFELAAGNWFADDTNSVEPSMEGVLGTGIAANLGSGRNAIKSGPVKIDDIMIVKIGENSHKIKIVGLIDQNMSSSPRGASGPARPGLYVSIKTAEKLSARPRQADFLFLRLRDGADVGQFREKWIDSHKDSPRKFSLENADDFQASLDATAENESRLGLGFLMDVNMITILFFATVAAVFIVFTTLSMGVGERARTIAMLRTIGMRRSSILALIFGEAMVICVLGLISGLLAGWIVLQSSIWLRPELRASGAMVSLRWETICTTGICVFIGTILATIIPAWRATLISPIEGLDRSYAAEIPPRKLYLAGLIGCVLLAIDPLVAFGPGFSPEIRKTLYYYLGLPSLVIGWLLVAPAAIMMIEKILTKPIAAILRIPSELLAGQLSGNLWRTLGTTISICLGLGLYTMFEIWGYSMLAPYVPGEKTPDTLVTLLPTGVPYENTETARNLPGVDSDRFMILEIEQPKFSKRQFDSKQFADVWRSQDNIVLFGLDPGKAFLNGPNGEKPLIELQFLEGTPEKAAEKMSVPGGRYCVIPDSFSIRANLKLGDKLELVVPEDVLDPLIRGRGRPVGPDGTDRPDRGEAERARPAGNAPQPVPAVEKILEYEICGIVSFPGSIWLSKTSGVRSRHGRTAAIAFAPGETVRNDFELKDVAFFWFDRKPGTDREDIEKTFTKFQTEFGENVAGTRRREGLGMPTGSRITAGAANEVRISTTESIAESVTDRSTEVIQSVAKMPLIILAISSIGMMGTIAASVRTRRYQIGVLRSLGLTRSGVLRMILGEALLIAVASIILSLCFGMLTAWCSAGIATYVSIFGSTVPSFVMPWKWLAIGFGTALGLCIIAALGPAFKASREEPASLLKER